MLSSIFLLSFLFFDAVQSTPSYTLGLMSPTSSDLDQFKIQSRNPFKELLSIYRRAIQEANAYFSKDFTLSYELLESRNDPSIFTNRFLELLSSTSPPVALIGPYVLDRLKYIAPLAEMSRVALVSPWISLSQMNRFLPRSYRMSLSMQVAADTYGDELIELLQYHRWSHIALIITQSPLQHHSPYEQSVRHVRFGADALTITVVATVWIPSLDDYGNDKAAFEAAITQEIEKIWTSGATVIVLSIEQVTTTYEVLMQVANRTGLVNAQTAWISLNIGNYYDHTWAVQEVRSDVWKLIDGMLITSTDLRERDGYKAPLSIYGDYIDYDSSTFATHVYDSVWAIAFAIQKSLKEGVSVRGYKVQIGDVQFQRWTSGEDIVRNIKATTFGGTSGYVSFRNDVRITLYSIYNIRIGYDAWGYEVGTYGRDKLKINVPIFWHGNAIRSPIGDIDICRHRINVLLPGGRYERYIEYSDDEKDGRHSGWAIDLFEEAARSRCLSNFKYYHISNVTWDEAIELVGSGRHSSIKGYDDIEFHVAIGPFAITPERSAKADFTNSIKSVSYRVAILRPETNVANLWEFFKPFSWELWVLTAVFFVASGFVLFLLEKNRKKFPAIAPKVGDSIFVSTSVLFYTHDQNSIYSNSGRGFIAVVCFVVLVICACFTANLSVFLLKRQETSTYETIEDIHDGVIGASNVTGSLPYLQHHYPRLRFVVVSPEDWLKRLTSKEIAAYVDDASILEFEARTNCEIKLLSDKLRVVNAAFALKHNSPYKEKLNRGIRDAWFDDFVEELDQKYFEWADECEGFGRVAADEPLQLRHLGGLFIILLAVAILCLLGDLVRRYVSCGLDARPDSSRDATDVVHDTAAESSTV